LPRYTGGLLHEPSVSRHIAERLQPDDVFVDVGAHVGYFAVLAAKFCKKVFAFEMQRCLMPLIERNININGFTNVHAIMPPSETSAVWRDTAARSSAHYLEFTQVLIPMIMPP
jgi:predicted RNA methylase